MADLEAALHVLAYLLRGRYQSTATAFLQECSLLPSKSLLVLPETPLQTIISEYKAHKDTRVLVDTLGVENTWSALWEKMEQNMAQLRNLSDELVSSHHSTVRRGGGRRRTRSHWKNTPQLQPSSVPTSHPHSSQPPSDPPPPSQPHTSSHTALLQPSQPHTTFPQHSPQKRKSALPKRKVDPSTSTPPEPSPAGHVTDTTPTDMQQVLEAMLCNGNLPGKLADIINKVAGREEENGDGCDERLELSPGTLDSILDLTCAEPEFEAVLGPSDPPPPTEDHRAIEIRVLAPQQDQRPPSQQPQDEVVRQCEEPSQKRPRLSEQSLPSGVDIESFLDQLHS